ISQKWAGFATLLSRGLSALPHGALQALLIAVLLGIVFTVIEDTRWKRFCPSPTGIGIGMLVPGSAIVTMFLGALVAAAWPKPANVGSGGENRTLTALASGFIAGEALIAVIVPILVTLGWVALHLACRPGPRPSRCPATPSSISPSSAPGGWDCSRRSTPGCAR